MFYPHHPSIIFVARLAQIYLNRIIQNVELLKLYRCRT
jgi:hypothetical protein